MVLWSGVFREKQGNKKKEKVTIMNSFVFQNSTKVYFGNDSVSTYLPGLLAQYGPKVMLTYGGGEHQENGYL